MEVRTTTRRTVSFLALTLLLGAGFGLAARVPVVSAQDASAPETASVEPSLARGEALFELCGFCHGPEGLGNQTLGAPGIAGLPEWYIQRQLESFRSGGRGTHPDDVEGMRMRPMSMTLRLPGDLESVAKYTAELDGVEADTTLEGGDPQRGSALFATCIACHGPKAEGNQALNAPTLHYQGDWYLVKQLQKFRAGIRGTNPKDTTGALMRPMAMALPDEQALLDVVAFISTLSK